MTQLALLAILAIACSVVWLLVRQAHTRRLVRAGYFDAVMPLFSGRIIALAPTGFPRMSGVHNGQLFDLQMVPDTLTYRKLPALWLLITLPSPVPTQATFDLMLRPTGVEPFSHFRQLPQQISTPSGFPTDCSIRTDDPFAMPDANLVARHLAGLDLDTLKEIVISPKGVRMVWLAEQADRTRYLLFRDAEMGQTPLLAARLLPLLHAVLALHADVSGSR